MRCSFFRMWEERALLSVAHSILFSWDMQVCSSTTHFMTHVFSVLSVSETALFYSRNCTRACICMWLIRWFKFFANRYNNKTKSNKWSSSSTNKDFINESYIFKMCFSWKNVSFLQDNLRIIVLKMDLSDDWQYFSFCIFFNLR